MRRRWISLLSLSLWAIPSAAADLRVEGSVEQVEVRQGEPFIFQIVVQGAEARDADLIEPDLASAGFKRVSVSNSFSTSISITGAGREILTRNVFEVGLLPTEPGRHTIPPFRVTAGQARGQTEPIALEVAAAAAPDRKRADVWVDVEVSNPRPYVGQQVHVRWLLYTQRQLQQLGVAVEPDLSGFWMEDRTPDQYKPENVVKGGVRYTRVVLKDLYLFPINSGLRTLDPLVVQAGVIKPERRSRSVFGNFFVSDLETINQGSASTTVEVVPLPEADRPGDFKGAVGRFQVAAELSPRDLRAGESATLTVAVMGTAHPDSFPDPTLDLPQGFEYYPPESGNESTITSGELVGRKTWKYLLVARQPGAYRFSPVRFSHFDPESGRYLSAESAPVEVTVAPGAQTVLPNLTPVWPGSAKPAYTETEIRYLRPSKTVLRSASNPIAYSPLFGLVQGIPWVVLAAGWVWRQRVEREERLAGQRVRRHALKRALRATRQATDAAGQERALIGYLSDRLGLPVQGLTREALDGRLAEVGLAPARRVELANLREELDRHRFTGDGSAVDAGALRRWMEAAEREWRS